MIHLATLIGLIVAVSVESFTIQGKDGRRLDEVACTYPRIHRHHHKYHIVPITDTYHGELHYKELSFHLNDKDVKINLKPNNGFLIHKNTPVWMVKRESGDVKFKKQNDALKNIETYTDETTHSSFAMIREPNGAYFYYGLYDYKIGVKAAPKEHTRRRREVEDNKTISNVDHYVFNLPRIPFVDSENIYTHFNTDLRNATSKLPTPDTVYPEILVIMDHKLYSHYNGSLQEALGYIITFWSAVDLLFRDLREPEVRLNIAGIVIEEEEDTLLDLSKLVELGEFRGNVNKDYVLDDIGFNLYKSPLKIRKDYDVALYMMGNDLVTTTEDWIVNETLGVAKIGCSCHKDDADKIIDAVAAFEDSNSYLGVLHAAHELAHLFGASHDGEEGITQLGLPGSENCKPKPEDDFLMSTMRTDGKQFSHCSKEAMRIFFHKQSSECLRNMPVMFSESTSPIKLPGKIVSLDEQCVNAGYLRASNNDRSVCDRLYCVVKEADDGIEYVTYIPGTESSICNSGFHCINGRCVEKKNTDV